MKLMNGNNANLFWYWINERHRMWYKRTMNKPYPWSKDPILNKYRFCNVFRELDKVTIWIKNNWREKYADHKNLWFALCVARQINSADTLSKLGFPVFSLDHYMDHVERVLAELVEEGKKIYGAAYIITAGGVSGPKYLYTCNHVLRPLSENRPAFTTGGSHSLQSMQRDLMQYIGFGSFIAYEVVSDLRWTRYYDGSDHMVWANPGPGARRGLARLYYGTKDAKIPAKDMLQMMQELLARSPKHLEEHVPSLEMRDIEHSLCEFDKYLRVKNGEGKPKQLYRGPK